jgi:hypothetical protein
MLDTTPVTTAITRLITAGTTEEALLSAVAHMFPDLNPAELSAALQEATRPPNGRPPGGTEVNAHQARRKPARSSVANSGGYGASAPRPIMS